MRAVSVSSAPAFGGRVATCCSSWPDTFPSSMSPQVRKDFGTVAEREAEVQTMGVAGQHVGRYLRSSAGPTRRAQCRGRPALLGVTAEVNSRTETCLNTSLRNLSSRTDVSRWNAVTARWSSSDGSHWPVTHGLFRRRRRDLPRLLGRSRSPRSPSARGQARRSRTGSACRGSHQRHRPQPFLHSHSIAPAPNRAGLVRPAWTQQWHTKVNGFVVWAGVAVLPAERQQR